MGYINQIFLLSNLILFIFFFPLQRFSFKIHQDRRRTWSLNKHFLKDERNALMQFLEDASWNMDDENRLIPIKWYSKDINIRNSNAFKCAWLLIAYVFLINDMANRCFKMVFWNNCSLGQPRVIKISSEVRLNYLYTQ